VLFLIRELRTARPIVELRTLADRNFAGGCVMISLFGCIIYGLVTILPLFFQTLLGYPAENAGMAVSPRGLGSIAAMFCVGYLSSRVDNRWLLFGGFTLCGISSLWLSNIDLQIGPQSLLVPIVLTGFAVGFIFPPLATTAMGTLPVERIGQASAIYNLVRNIGGSIGISVLSALLERRQQVHRTQLVEHLYGSNPAVQRSLRGLQQITEAHAGAATPLERAYALLDNTLSGQAQLWSYVDDFHYLALICFLCLPLLLLLKNVRGRGGMAVH
jgi:DHA2 family multidrug resistance protein